MKAQARWTLISSFGVSGAMRYERPGLHYLAPEFPLFRAAVREATIRPRYFWLLRDLLCLNYVCTYALWSASFKIGRARVGKTQLESLPRLELSGRLESSSHRTHGIGQQESFVRVQACRKTFCVEPEAQTRDEASLSTRIVGLSSN